MAKQVIGTLVKCDHGREAKLDDQELLDREKEKYGSEQGAPGRHACTVCAWRLGYEAAVADTKKALEGLLKARL